VTVRPQVPLRSAQRGKIDAESVALLSAGTDETRRLVSAWTGRLANLRAVKLEDVAAVLGPAEVVAPASVEIRDLAYDARSVTPGALFFAVPGSRADGHDHASAAVDQGAAALVVERPLAVAVPQLVVPDARAAMAPAADAFFGRPSDDLRVAAVTGTNGKTTTAFLLRSILEAAGLRPGLVGNIERVIGGESRPADLNTPEAIDLQRLFREMLDAGDRSVAMEASSHASVQHRLDCVRFAALVFTNLTQDHLDFHGTMERYFEAKRRLFLTEPRPPAAVNVDDPWGRRLAEELDGALTFGFAADADLRPEGLELSAGGARFRAAGIDLRTRLRGRFNVENVLGAVAAARLLGIDDDAIAAGVESLRGVPGRFEAVEEGQPFAVLVDYSHTPDSLENALRAARDLGDGRVLAVFGCGGDRDRAKRPLMGRVASELADVAILTSDNPRGEDPDAIIAETLTGAVGDVEVEPDRREAIVRAVELARPGDVVLIAGKGHEQGQEIAGRKLPFDDRAVAREALRALTTSA
jgi:UDP-N-acetylmuramoyl-L-alanyl-D-glutamate--2,6-diaminopimelate ligase